MGGGSLRNGETGLIREMPQAEILR
ncbi:MAG: hypothetical protein H6Q33_4699, partial [Deltaproteobacteria bacterium]|nr:hypothetical protein [Deltaproteobacteria bacterium]